MALLLLRGVDAPAAAVAEGRMGMAIVGVCMGRGGNEVRREGKGLGLMAGLCGYSLSGSLDPSSAHRTTQPSDMPSTSTWLWTAACVCVYGFVCGGEVGMGSRYDTAAAAEGGTLIHQ